MISIGGDRSPGFAYDIVIESDEENVRIDWGNAPEWIELHRELLESATRIAFIPKYGVTNYPIVAVALNERKRWIIFSRVFSRTDTLKRMRVYAIGWQSTVQGVNTKSIQWVFPGGTVENADSPDNTLVRRLLLS